MANELSPYEQLYYGIWPDGEPLGRPATPEDNLIQRCTSLTPAQDSALLTYLAQHPELTHLSQAIRVLLTKALTEEGLLQ